MSNPSKSLLLRTLSKYGEKCLWCQSSLIELKEYRNLSNSDKRIYRIATVDHILPKSFGGPDYIENVRPSCIDCNSSRGNGWRNQEAEVFPSCPLLQMLESKRPSLNLKLSFLKSTKWNEKWAHRVRAEIIPHSYQRKYKSKED